MTGLAFAQQSQLPWEVTPQEAQRFRKILWVLLGIVLLFGLIIPWLSLPEPERVKKDELPPRLVKLVLERKKVIKPPPPPVQQVETQPEPEPEPQPKPKEEPKVVEQPAEPTPKPIPKPSARETAKKHMAVFDELADLRNTQPAKSLKDRENIQTAGGQAATTSRNLIADKAKRSSGGIDTARASSQGGGGGALADGGTTRVSSSIGGAGGGGDVARGAGGAGIRSSENIQKAFDREQASFHALHRRAQRKNPAIAGRLRFRLVIEPSGKVSHVSIISSELGDPELEKKVLDKIRRMNFGALKVQTWDDSFHFDFFRA